MNQSKPSKSERKRRQLALQRLGEQLIGLDDRMLDQLALDERLLDAVTKAKAMKSNEALRRQKQFIGRLMRDVDSAPIEALLDRLRADERREKSRFANAERWRSRILRGRGPELDAFAAATGASLDEIRPLVDELRQARSDRKERELERRLFRAIHAALVVQSRDG